jgi:hypothetical protein
MCYAMTMALGIGPIKGTYSGTVALLNVRAPDEYGMEVEATGGPGFVKELSTWVNIRPGKPSVRRKGPSGRSDSKEPRSRSGPARRPFSAAEAANLKLEEPDE